MTGRINLYKKNSYNPIKENRVDFEILSTFSVCVKLTSQLKTHKLLGPAHTKCIERSHTIA